MVTPAINCNSIIWRASRELPESSIRSLITQFDQPEKSIENLKEIESALSEIFSFEEEGWSEFPISPAELLKLLLEQLQCYLEHVPEVTDYRELGLKTACRVGRTAFSVSFGEAD